MFISSNRIVRHAMEWCHPEQDKERRKLLRELDKVQDAWMSAATEMMRHPNDKTLFEAADNLRKRSEAILEKLNSTESGREKCHA